MTTEQLLQDRYIVIAPVPNEPAIAVGDIYMFQQYMNCFYNFGKNDTAKPLCIGYRREELDRYTANFRKLFWWEKRDIADLPRFVKDIRVGKVVVRVYEYFPDRRLFISENNSLIGHCSELHQWTPATKEEYDQFMVTKNQRK